MTLNLDHTHSSNSIPIPCRGCRHYYGRLDGGNRLNCAIHPLGPTEASCPDHEGLSAESPRTSGTITCQDTTMLDPWEMPANAADRWAMMRRMMGALNQVVEDLMQ